MLLVMLIFLLCQIGLDFVLMIGMIHIKGCIFELHDPFLMEDMENAVDRLQLAIDEQQRVMLFGDYDVDGTTAVALMYSYLKETLPVDFYIPDRYKEGYGLSITGIDVAKKNNVDLIISLDCGIKSIEESLSHLKQVDGVMIGREAYGNPYILAEADSKLFGSEETKPTRIDVIERLIPYVESHLASGGKLQHITRHILGLFHAQPNGKMWRRHLSEQVTKPNAQINVLTDALKLVS